MSAFGSGADVVVDVPVVVVPVVVVGAVVVVAVVVVAVVVVAVVVVAVVVLQVTVTIVSYVSGIRLCPDNLFHRQRFHQQDIEEAMGDQLACPEFQLRRMGYSQLRQQ